MPRWTYYAKTEGWLLFPSPWVFFEFGAFLSKAFRGIDLDFLVVEKAYDEFYELPDIEQYLQLVEYFWKRIDTLPAEDMHNVRNLILFPDTYDMHGQPRPWVEDEFATVARDIWEAEQDLDYFAEKDYIKVEGGLDTWNKYGTEWYKNGI